VLSLRHGLSRRIMTLFPLLMSPSLLIFPLIHGGLTRATWRPDHKKGEKPSSG
jgi:hypothetical protein